MNRKSVLFVCLGNICRSPLAEGALRQRAEEEGLELKIDSAGTGDWHVGCEPDRRAQAVAARHGIDISRIRSRQVRLRDFQDFDHIVAMDGDNLAALRQIAPPGTEGKLSLLLDHVPGRAGQSVADPYFGGAEGFDATWADLVLGIDGLVPRLRG